MEDRNNSGGVRFYEQISDLRNNRCVQFYPRSVYAGLAGLRGQYCVREYVRKCSAAGKQVLSVVFKCVSCVSRSILR